MDHMRHLLLLAAAIAAFAAPTYAQTPSATAQFVEKAAIGDMFEIQSSELALEKSKNADVQTFARKIIQDHRANSEELKAFLQKSADLQRIQLPTALDQAHQQKLQQLRSGSGFENPYRTAQVEGHEDAIKLFEDYARAGDNADLKKWAEGKVPILRGHLQMAQALPQSSPVAGAAPAVQTPAASATQNQMQGLATPGPNHIMASELEGTAVRSANDENIGEIDEIVLDREGRVVAVVVGVGGFLGIGEKDVAIPFSALEIVASDANAGSAYGTQPARTGDTRNPPAGGSGTMDPSTVVLRGMTRADLERAPEFKARDPR
jgi:putative membrane protein